MGVNSVSSTGYNQLEKPERIVPNINLQTQPQPQKTEKAVADKQETNNGLDNDQKEKKIAQLKSAIDAANNKLKFTRTKCEFKYYDDVNRVAIKVIDRETDEVIREIPPEETIELVQKLWELAGIIVDEKR